VSGATTRLRVEHLHQPDGWLTPGFVEIDAQGVIARVANAEPAEWAGQTVEQLDGYTLPGLPNLHSHAHQRGLAGRAEGGSGATEAENFWTWRTRMYDFALRLDPDDLYAIAAQAYVEMLKAGFTTVGEFHYLHHDPAGQPYANPAELSEQLLAASIEAGIAITLLPSLYTRGGIGQPPAPEQRRFVHANVADFNTLVERVSASAATVPGATIGIAPHSLRAVSAAELREVLAAWPQLPVHMHVAEQVREVEECVAGLGAPPASWLLDEAGADARWTFIHATHASHNELTAMAARGVVVSLCPLTEGNLGDGVFALTEFVAAGGRWGVGTDSNIAISVSGELQQLEYSQRLTRQRRSVLVTPGSPQTEQPGRQLYDRALAGGAQALAQPIGAIAPGKRADLCVLDAKHPALAGADERTVLDQWLLTATSPVVQHVMVNGRWGVRDGRHAHEDVILQRYRAALARLTTQD
jgi:formimidoylglutamate deiminase